MTDDDQNGINTIFFLDKKIFPSGKSYSNSQRIYFLKKN